MMEVVAVSRIWIFIVVGLVVLGAVGAFIFWWMSRGPDDD